jgi:hypothetical protein
MCAGWRKENIDLHDEVGVFGSRSCTAGRSNIVLVVVFIYSAKRPRTEKLDLNLVRIRSDTPYTAWRASKECTAVQKSSNISLFPRTPISMPMLTNANIAPVYAFVCCDVGGTLPA